MMTVKSLLVKIGADISELQSGLRNANTALEKHKKQFRQVGMAMTAVGGGITAALGGLINHYKKAGDEVQKMALRTGFSTEALSELKYAAQISGASLQGFEKGVKKMQKTIVDASEGMTTYLRAFERIGIEVKDLQGLSPEQQFLKIADAIGKVKDPTIQAATATDIFGRAGTQLLPFFKQGPEGMEKLRKKAHELGVVFDKEAADKAAALADAQTDLKASLSGLAISIGNVIIPKITDLVEKVSQVISKVSAWAKEHPKLTSLIVKLGGAVGVLGMALGPIVMVLPALASGFAMLAGPIGIAMAAVTALAGVAFLVIKNWKPISEFFKKLWGTVSAVFKAAWMTIANNVKAAWNFILSIFKAVISPIINISKAIGSGAIQAFTWLGNKAKDIFNWMAEKIIGAMTWLMGKLAKIPVVKKFAKNLHQALEETNQKLNETKLVTEEASVTINKDFGDSLGNTQLKLKDYWAEVGTAEEKTKSWLDYLKDLGIKTIKEKRDRVEELEKYMKQLEQAYKDGKISLDDYEKAVNSAKKEIEELSTTLSETAIPAARDMSDVLGQAISDMEEDTKGFKESTKKNIKTDRDSVVNMWKDMAESIRSKWINELSEALQGAKSFKDALKGVWGTIKTQFFDLVAKMVTKWTLGFVANIFFLGFQEFSQV